MSTQYTIQNGSLTAVFSTYAAELISLKNADGKEYIFRDKAYWGYSAPTLFPICGGLKDDLFRYHGNEYHLIKHGFAKISEFQAEAVTADSITFLLTDTPETLKSYPFSFELRITYALSGNTLSITYRIKNPAGEEMYYSIGSHEAYACPGGIEGYSLVFDRPLTLDSNNVRGNLIDYSTTRVLENSDTFRLSYDYFKIDSLVFPEFPVETLRLEAIDGSRKIRIDFPEFSQMIFWANAGLKAPFICIEPWCGFPDMVDSDYDITRRRGIVRLPAGGEKTHTHSMTILK